LWDSNAVNVEARIDPIVIELDIGPLNQMLDYYEFLQISPNADTDTIHRVYRFLATRLHPDNPESGDPEMFHVLKTAYDVLSNSTRRSEYDATRKQESAQPVPLSMSVDFMDTLDGELNRRLAVLAVLYYRRRTHPHAPEVPLAEIELRMGFPRDYLDFTTWYLVKKGYVVRADNAEFTLTADGVDFVETQRGNLPILNKMLTCGVGITEPTATRTQKPMQMPIVLPSRMEPVAQRRIHSKDRLLSTAEVSAHVGVDTLDRREDVDDRRKNLRGRRATD
jgi:curved DNA-binding protein